jgi:signal transduction histidine kinase
LILRRLASLSLLWKILLSTSIAITILFAVTVWIVQRQFVNSASETLEEEVRGSFTAYESLWRARGGKLAALSLLLSRMPDVRAAFGTGDQLTIRDTAGEIWNRISEEDAVFVVTDPAGTVLASLGGDPPSTARSLSETVRAARERFPGQSSGFRLESGVLYQTVITPVYVAATDGSALINVLVAGYVVNTRLARQLKESTGGSDFVFLIAGRVVASSLGPVQLSDLDAAPAAGRTLPHVMIAGAEFAQFATPLVDTRGQTIGELRVLRSFDSARARIDSLRLKMIGGWLLAVLAGLGLTYLLARRILEPVRALDSAAAEVARGNYAASVEVPGDDELGRLSRTFNHMRRSIQSARQELIRQERLSTISRLSTSIVHDLRNPLAAIYGGAEMLVDGELPPQQVKRLASNIYESSRRVQELLTDLTDVTRGRTKAAEPCDLRDVVEAARSVVAPEADRHHVVIDIDVPDDIVLQLERSRIERVVENLMINAVEAMPSGGRIDVTAAVQGDVVALAVQDSGPGLNPAIWPRLFEPFVTEGKRRGMGLGLALSRQTVRDHGGDLLADPPSPGSGARFVIRLPL